MIVRVGHKGRYVGVVGAFRTGQAARPFDLRYQLITVGPEYETPRGKEATNPVMALMEEYAQEVRDRDYLSKYPRTTHKVQHAFPNAKYVGSERCAGCHKEAYEVWLKADEQGHSHSHAYNTLVKADRPGLRQFDGECVQCHTVGFGYHTGFANAKDTPKLMHVGCESCHGPCSEHVKDTRNEKIHRLINPWKADPARLAAAKTREERDAIEHHRLLDIDKFCQSCHDGDNDVNWKFEKKWPKIVHMSPPRAAAAPPPQPEVKPEVPVAVPDVPPQPQFPPQPEARPQPGVQPQANDRKEDEGRRSIFKLFRPRRNN
jgi:nitrate reductase cytochrome c-type subunit